MQRPRGCLSQGSGSFRSRTPACRGQMALAWAQIPLVPWVVLPQLPAGRSQDGVPPSQRKGIRQDFIRRAAEVPFLEESSRSWQSWN